MTDKTALRQLIEAVEVGDLTDVNNNLGRMFSELGNDWPWDWISKINSAHRGSLDAAKALHDALLPGWGWEVNRLSAVVQSPHGDRFFGQRVSDVTSRLFLIAILKAYEAQK